MKLHHNVLVWCALLAVVASCGDGPSVKKSLQGVSARHETQSPQAEQTEEFTPPPIQVTDPGTPAISYDYRVRIVGVFQPNWSTNATELQTELQINGGKAIRLKPSNGDRYHRTLKNRFYVTSEWAKTLSETKRFRVFWDIFSEVSKPTFVPTPSVNLAWEAGKPIHLRVNFLDYNFILDPRVGYTISMGHLETTLLIEELNFSNKDRELVIVSEKPLLEGEEASAYNGSYLVLLEVFRVRTDLADSAENFLDLE